MSENSATIKKYLELFFSCTRMTHRVKNVWEYKKIF